MIKLLATTALLTLAANAALAANNIDLITTSDTANVALLDIEGNGNTLSIVQDSAGFVSGNTLTLSIKGDFNGGPLGSEFSGDALMPGLEPGTISQHGSGNSISMDVLGSNNLFAIAQSGIGNIVTASITGVANQASIYQAGNNNVVGFSQSGIGNIVSVTQTSW
jgi:hypothetical protein